MGISKTDAFTGEQNQLAVLAKALGHPARIAIIEYLARQENCICKDIVEELPLAQPTISQHLRELKQAGLIQGSIEGNTVCYCLNPTGFKQLAAFFSAIIEKASSSNTSCCL